MDMSSCDKEAPCSRANLLASLSALLSLLPGEARCSMCPILSKLLIVDIGLIQGGLKQMHLKQDELYTI